MVQLGVEARRREPLNFFFGDGCGGARLGDGYDTRLDGGGPAGPRLLKRCGGGPPR